MCAPGKFTALGGDVIGKDKCANLRHCIMKYRRRENSW
jgi:hypothetical protein